MSKRVLVTNIPVCAFVDGWVDVPDDTQPDNMNDAIGSALCERGFSPASPRLRVPEQIELSEELIRSGWEFTWTE